MDGDERFATAVLESLSAGVVGIDARARVRVFNEGARRLLDGAASAASPLGRPCREVLEPWPRLVRLLLGALDGAAPVARAELEIEGKPGASPRLVGFSLTDVRGPSGSTAGAVLFMRDLAPYRRLAERTVSAAIVGRSPALREAYDLARRVAPTRSTVLITGETGTGKELLARLVHEASPRGEGPFVEVNCAALPETLLESELFGHERGAFTGADRRRVGRFEEASGGTLFLDEIGDLAPATQAKLLRVLQDQAFHRLGGTQTLRTDARIVAATNAELEAKVARGEFRDDLYFRLDVIRIQLPPLRERPGDAEDLARHFLAELGNASGPVPRGFSPAALRHIREHAWPGNVRELRNAVERAILLADGERIEAPDLNLAQASPAASDGWRPELPPAGWSLADLERALVVEALRNSRWVQKEAARRLGVSPRKLNYMIASMGITHPSWRRNRRPDRPAR
jgi:transcriptional regulator with GAF, ATPase, and Fis domain